MSAPRDATAAGHAPGHKGKPAGGAPLDRAPNAAHHRPEEPADRVPPPLPVPIASFTF